MKLKEIAISLVLAIVITLLVWGLATLITTNRAHATTVKVKTGKSYTTVELTLTKQQKREVKLAKIDRATQKAWRRFVAACKSSKMRKWVNRRAVIETGTRFKRNGYPIKWNRYVLGFSGGTSYYGAMCMMKSLFSRISVSKIEKLERKDRRLAYMATMGQVQLFMERHFSNWDKCPRRGGW